MQSTDRWPGIAVGLSPKLLDHVQAVTFHPATGQLDLRPDSPVYATQLRLITPRIVAAANESAGTDVMRTVRVLPVGTSPAPRVMEPAPAAIPEAPVKTRESASEGYRQALAAHQSAAYPSRVNPSIRAAVERQTKAMRELSARAFPSRSQRRTVSQPRSPQPVFSIAANPRPPVPWRCTVPGRNAPPGRLVRQPLLPILPRCVRRREHGHDL
ncbi:hypothetical protein [Streptomyces sp. NBC_00328]|uniref:hypothetical protein n=1 Tax=Streptomyces sp. NBC_00328 TaxID=2903646 RepID=UPI002E2A1DE4|nr:hypothetical protein [Streptomyces sp. NBC_00328]